MQVEWKITKLHLYGNLWGVILFILFILSWLNFNPDDYKKLLKLALLSGIWTECIQIIAPEKKAFHRARWMAKLIYCLKIYLFRFQFHLTTREIAGLQQFNNFVM